MWPLRLLEAYETTLSLPLSSIWVSTAPSPPGVELCPAEASVDRMKILSLRGKVRTGASHRLFLSCSKAALAVSGSFPPFHLASFVNSHVRRPLSKV